jgi:hypothetical protein
MAQSIGHLHLEGAPEPIPYFVDPQGETRLLAAFPTPRDHMMFSLPTWEQAGFPTIPRSDWRAFDERQKSIPILDQDGKGACLPHGFATACMSAVLKSGAKFVELCPWFLYTLINRGMDAGSNAGDAIQALTTTGIAPKGIVPYGTIRPKGYNSTAMAAASRFKLLDAVQIKGFDQAVSAILLGFDVTLDVCAGPGFDTNSEGVCRYLMGPNNHEVFMGGGIQRLANADTVASVEKKTQANYELRRKIMTEARELARASAQP